MPKKRPVAVTVIAILNLIGGSLGLASFLCLGCIGIFFYTVVQSADPKAKNELSEVFTSLPQYVPGLVPYFITILVYGLIMLTVLFAAGIGLLKMMRWARIASIAYALISIIVLIPNTAYSVMYLSPGMEKWQNELMAKKANPNGPPPPVIKQDPAVQMVSTVFGAIMGLIYPVALLIVLFLPHVSAAFAQQGSESSYRGGREEEEDQYERGWGSSGDRPPP